MANSRPRPKTGLTRRTRLSVKSAALDLFSKARRQATQTCNCPGWGNRESRNMSASSRLQARIGRSRSAGGLGDRKQGGMMDRNVEQCECHDCTQARYRQSFRYQFDQAMNPIKHPTIAPKPEAPRDVPSHLIRDSQTLCGLTKWEQGNVDFKFGIERGIVTCLGCLRKACLELLSAPIEPEVPKCPVCGAVSTMSAEPVDSGGRLRSKPDRIPRQEWNFMFPYRCQFCGLWYFGHQK